MSDCDQLQDVIATPLALSTKVWQVLEQMDMLECLGFLCCRGCRSEGGVCIFLPSCTCPPFIFFFSEDAADLSILAAPAFFCSCVFIPKRERIHFLYSPNHHQMQKTDHALFQNLGSYFRYLTNTSKVSFFAIIYL